MVVLQFSDPMIPSFQMIFYQVSNTLFFPSQPCVGNRCSSPCQNLNLSLKMDSLSEALAARPLVVTRLHRSKILWHPSWSMVLIRMRKISKCLFLFYYYAVDFLRSYSPYWFIFSLSLYPSLIINTVLR